MRYNLIINPIRRLTALVDQPEGWQARHFAVAPFGGLLSTWLWVNCGPQWAQIDNFGVLFYGALAVMLEGGYQVFYAISKRRRDINAAEDRGRGEGRVEGREEGREEGRMEGREEGRMEGREEGRMEGREEGRVEGREEGRMEGREEGREEGLEEGRTEGLEEGRTSTLDDLAARLKDNPDAIAAIAEVRAQSQNGDHQ